MANEISKKKQLRIAENRFEMKETAKEQFDLNNKLPLGELKNYTTGKLLNNHEVSQVGL